MIETSARETLRLRSNHARSPELVEGRLSPPMPCFDELSTGVAVANRDWTQAGRAPAR
jgi:hypothetical protein